MVEMEIEELLSYASLCGIWMDSFRSLSQEKLFFLLNKKPGIRYIAYCLINKNSLFVGKKLRELQTFAPFYRTVAIGNDCWYSNQSIDTQNSILRMKDQADIFIRCSFPVEDARNALLLLCDYILSISPKRQEVFLAKTDNFAKSSRSSY